MGLAPSFTEKKIFHSSDVVFLQRGFPTWGPGGVWGDSPAFRNSPASWNIATMKISLQAPFLFGDVYYSS